MNNQLSLFGEPASDPVDETPKIQDVREVFEMAREAGLIGPDEKEAEDNPALNAIRERKLENAAALGLVAKWGDYRKAKGYVSIHDPTSGRWHDLPFKEAQKWAQWEATKRSEIYRKTGDHGAFDLNASQMHAIWEEETPPWEEEGIVEEYELPDD